MQISKKVSHIYTQVHNREFSQLPKMPYHVTCLAYFYMHFTQNICSSTRLAHPFVQELYMHSPVFCVAKAKVACPLLVVYNSSSDVEIKVTHSPSLEF